MQHSRSERLAATRQARAKRLKIGAITGAAVVLVCAAVLGWNLGLSGLKAWIEGPAGVKTAGNAKGSSRDLSSTFASDDTSAAPYLAYGGTASAETSLVEVPDVTGRSIGAAVVVLGAAGLRADTPAGTPSATQVTDQQPRAGEIVGEGSLVRLVTASSWASKFVGKRRPVVCIDPGHQSLSNNSPEAIGPGSAETKAKCTGGATGIVTRLPEYEIVLQIAMNVRARLIESGVDVVMTRTTDDVDLSNIERAKIANKASANLFVRIHANGSTNERQAGVSLLYPAATGYTKATSSASKRAAQLLQQSVLSATGAPSDGMYARSDLAGFNWCNRPAVLIECGYLTNPVEDRLLAGPAYQDKIALGITRGILTYLTE